MSQKSPSQPGSNPNQNHHKDTGGDKPNMQKVMQNEDKSKQGPEDDHDNEGKTLDQLRDERGGQGRSGHSSSRSGSDSGSGN
ncbi:MAG: hypothetical protein LH606_22820 [Cytophagaceae bacterium]|nr:hypothetical protein [Cytophagaceae bacterium]